MKPLLGVVAVAALVLTACGSHQSTPQAKVPALPTTGASSASGASGAAAATTSSDPEAGRPRERLDMTNDELSALSAVYMQCMTANGWDKRKADTDPAAVAKAEAVCHSKNPLPPWELDASNPHASDFVHALVQCLRGKGVKYVDEVPPQGGRYSFSFGGTSNDSDSISKGMRLTPVCEKEVAAKGIGR
jgi:hypothetical protein